MCPLVLARRILSLLTKQRCLTYSRPSKTSTHLLRVTSAMGLYCKAYIYIIVIVIKNSDYVNRLKSLRFDIQKCIYAITEQTFTLKEGIISPLTPFVLCSL